MDKWEWERERARERDRERKRKLYEGRIRVRREMSRDFDQRNIRFDRPEPRGKDSRTGFTRGYFPRMFEVASHLARASPSYEKRREEKRALSRDPVSRGQKINDKFIATCKFAFDVVDRCTWEFITSPVCDCFIIPRPVIDTVASKTDRVGSSVEFSNYLFDDGL